MGFFFVAGWGAGGRWGGWEAGVGGYMMVQKPPGEPGVAFVSRGWGGWGSGGGGAERTALVLGLGHLGFGGGGVGDDDGRHDCCG